MSNKHDANVRKSTLVNFQIGLVASLLFTYVMFEVYTAVPIVVVEPPEQEFIEEFNFSIDDFIIEKKVQKELAVKAKPKTLATEFIEKEDNEELEKFEKEFVNTEQPEKVLTHAPPIGSIDDREEEEEVVIHDFISVEDVPLFPGCEKLKTNAERAACFSEKIRKIVAKKFNTDLGQRYGLTGLQRIYTQFDVDAKGMINNIQIRAPHPKLEKETKRVIGLFPQMTPGKQRGNPVTVKYQLPIVFKIQD